MKSSVQAHSHSRKTSGLAVMLLALVCGTLLPALANAQAVYRIVGADGRVTFSDKAPASPAKISTLDPSGKEVSSGGATLPYELRQVVNKYPVTLYTSKDCAPCDAGRSMLRSNGIPFVEKTISTQEDMDTFQRLSSSTSLPMLTVGGKQIKGFSDSEWLQYLRIAGYPEKSQLPAGYRNPPSSALVEIKTKPSLAKTSDPADSIAPPPTQSGPSPSNPAGIKF